MPACMIHITQAWVLLPSRVITYLIHFSSQFLYFYSLCAVGGLKSRFAATDADGSLYAQGRIYCCRVSGGRGDQMAKNNQKIFFSGHNFRLHVEDSIRFQTFPVANHRTMLKENAYVSGGNKIRAQVCEETAVFGALWFSRL